MGYRMPAVVGAVLLCLGTSTGCAGRDYPAASPRASMERLDGTWRGEIWPAHSIKSSNLHAPIELTITGRRWRAETTGSGSTVRTEGTVEADGRGTLRLAGEVVEGGGLQNRSVQLRLAPWRPGVLYGWTETFFASTRVPATVTLERVP